MPCSRGATGTGGRVAVVIPARYGATRLPGKPLAEIDGRPMIWYVWSKASAAKLPSRVVVATTTSGSPRWCADSGARRSSPPRMRLRNRPGRRGRPRDGRGDPDQPAGGRAADAPVGDRRGGRAPARRAGRPDVDGGASPRPTRRNTCAPPWSRWWSTPGATRSTFSRSPVRTTGTRARGRTGSTWGSTDTGREFLFRVAALRPSPLEEAERLEQLRVLQAGYRIRVVDVAHDSVGVDTPEDLKAVEERVCGPKRR